MNKIFKVIWDQSTQTWVAVSELTKAHGKTKSLTRAVAVLGGLVAGNVLAANVVTGDTNTGLDTNKEVVVYGKDIAVGPGTQTDNTLVGSNITTTNNAYKNTVVGNHIVANTVNGTLIGHNVSISGEGSVGIGKDIAAGNGDQYKNALIGNNITTTNGAHSNSVLGNAIHVNSVSSTLIGSNISGNAHNIVGIGKDINISGGSGIAIGHNVSSSGGSLVLGTNATSSKDGVVIGRGAVNEYNYDTVIGIGAKSTLNAVTADKHDDVKGNNPPAVVIGFNANSSSIMGDVVIGAWASSSFSELDRTFKIGQATAIGSRATVYGDQGNAIGGDTLALGNSSIAIGGDDINLAAKALVDSVPTAIKYVSVYGAGYDAKYIGKINSPGSKIRRVSTQLTALGKTAQANLINKDGGYVQTTAAGDASTAIGPQAMTLGVGSQAFGVNPLALGHSSIAMGSFATAGRDLNDGDNSVAIGSVSSALGSSSIAMGRDSISHARNDVAIGLRATAGFADAPSMSDTAKTALSELQKAAQTGTYRVDVLNSIKSAWGKLDQTTKEEINQFLDISIKSTMQNGWKVNSLSEEQLNETGFEAILAYAEAIKNSEKSGESFPDAGQFKQQLKALLVPKEVGADAIAVGRDANALVGNGIAIGTGAQVGNVTDTNSAGVNTQKTNGIAIGKGSIVTGESSIAVGVENRVSGDYSGVFGDPSIVEGTASYTFGNDNVVSRNTTGAFVMGNRNRMGAKPTYDAGDDINSVEVDVTQPLTGIAALGVTGEDIRDVSGSVVIGNDNTVTSKDTFILGSSINTLNNIQTGSGTVANSVYLGKDSTAKAGAPTAAGTLKNIQDNGQDGVSTTGGDKGKVDTATVANVTYQGFQGNTADGVVTVGSAGHERRIQNVAAGEISSTSTDAINGSQLYLTHKAIDDVVKNIPFKYTVKDQNGNNTPVINIDGKFYNPNDLTNLQYDPKTKAFYNKTDGSPATAPTEVPANTVNVSSALDNTNTPDTLNNIKGSLPQTVNRGDKAQDANTVLPTTGVGATDATPKQDAPGNIAAIYNNAATVGDVLNAGWNLQGDGKPVDFVKPYDTVNFIDTDTANITVASTDGKTSTIKVDVITTTLSNDEGTVDIPQGKDGAKLVNATAVANAINDSGWKVTINRDENEFEDQDGADEKLITMGKTATFMSGKNLKVKQNDANITFATENDVEFNSVTVPGENTPDKSAVSISREGDVGKITLNGDGGAAAAITVIKGVGNLDAATNTQNDRLVYTDSKGENQPIATMNDGLKFAGNNVKEAINSHKLGSTVNIVGERDDGKTAYDDDSAKNNIIVQADGNNKLTVKLAKDLVNLKSVTTKDNKDNTSVMNATGITITPLSGDGAGFLTGTGSPVSLTNTGLNNGGNVITNVAGHLPGAVGKYPAPETHGKLPEDWDEREIRDNIENDAATVGDVLNAGWNLKGPKEAFVGGEDQIDFVRPYDSVKFNHGKNTRVSVGTNDKKTENTIKFDVDLPVAYTDQDGNPLAQGEDGNYYKVGADGNITDQASNGEVKISLINPDNQNGVNNETGEPVTLTNLKDNIGESATVLPQTAGSPFTKENFDANTDGHNAATVNDVLNAGWNAYVDDATDVNNFRALVNPADKVVFKGENGVTVSAETESNEGVTTFTFAADTAELTPIAEGTDNAGSIDALSDEEGKKLVNATTVAKAINESGFNLKASAVDDEGELVDGDDPADKDKGELIKSGKTVEMIAGKNLSVKHDKEGKITYATKDDVEFKSVQLGENKEGPKLTATDDNTGIKVSDKDGTEPVHITNLKGNFDGANNQAAPTTEALATNKPQEVTNAATVGDVLNAGWNLQENGTAKDFVRHADTVNFANGTGTTVSITPNDPTTSTIKVNLDFGTITSDKTTGAVTEVTDDNKVASTKTVADAIRNSGWKLTDGKGKDTIVNPSDSVTFKDSNTTSAVVNVDDKNAPYVTFEVKTTELKVSDGTADTAVDGSNVAGDKGKVVVPTAEADKKKLVDAEHIANAINNSGFTLKTSKAEGGDQDGTSQDELITPGKSVEMIAGKNLKVKQEANGKVTYLTKDDVEFTSVQFGENGPKISKGDNGEIKVGDKDGNAVKITNVAAGAEKYTGTATAKDGLTNLENATESNALTVADAKTMGWIVSSDKKTSDLGTAYSNNVTNAKEVKFVGEGDLVTVSGDDEGDVRKITIKVNSGTVGADENTGLATSGPDGLATTANVKDAINKSGWTLKDKAGNTTLVNPSNVMTFDESDTITPVVTDDPANPSVKFNAKTTALEAVEPTDQDPNAKPGSIKEPTDGKQLVNASTVAAAINASGWNVDVDHDETDFQDKAGQGKSLVKAGETAVFKSGKNLKVKKDGTNITFATKDEVEFTSVQLGNNQTGPKLTNDGGNIKVGDKDLTNPVHITNVAGNLDGAKKTTTAPTTEALSANKPTGDALNNVATVGDVLNAGWNLKENGTARDFVRHTDTVNFVNGTGTIVSITPDAENNPTNSTVKVDIDFGDISADDKTGAVTSTDPKADKVASTKDVAEAIAASGWKLTDGKGKDTIVNPSDSVTFKDSNTTSAVVNVDDKNAPYVTFEVKTTELKVSDGTADTAVDGSNVAGDKGKVVVPTAEADKKKLVDAEHIANAINNSGFTLKTSKAEGGDQDGTSQDELITPGKSVEMVAGKNLKVKQETNGKVTYLTKDDVEFTSVQFGKDGPKLQAENGKIKVSGANGTDMAKITNVAAAAPKYPVVANDAKSGLANLDLATESDVFTVADAKAMGWIVSTGTDAATNTYANKVTNAQEVHFVGKNGISVTGADVGEKRVVTIDIKQGDMGNENGAATSGPNNPTGFTTANTVRDAINNSGWTLKDKAGNTTLVNPSNVMTFDESDTITPVVTNDPANPSVKFNAKTTALTPITADTATADKKAGTIDVPTGDDAKKLVNASTVASAINNSGFNLKASAEAGKGELDKSGSAKPTGEQINPGDEIEMVAGKNMTVKHDKEGKITYATKDDVNFNSVSLNQTDENGKPVAGKPTINFKNEEGRPATNKDENSPAETPTALNISSSTGSNTQLTGVGSVLNTTNVATNPGLDAPQDWKDDNKLVDLGTNGTTPLTDKVLDSAATVRDLANMGWVVSTSKDGEETYADTVKNANQVDFVGTDGISVTGRTTEDGVREITIALEKGEVVKSNEFIVTKDDGSSSVAVKVGDKYYAKNDIDPTTGQPKEGKQPIEITAYDTVENKGSGFVTGNAVADAIQASGFTVGKATAETLADTTFDNKDEKVNPDDNMRFADGKGTIVSLGTVKKLDAKGEIETTTTLKVDVDLPIDFKYVNEAGDEIVKADDGKFYKATDVENGKPKQDATALDADAVAKLVKQAQLTNGLNSNGKPNAKYTVNPEAAKIENKELPKAGEGGVTLNNVAWAVNPDQAVNKDQLDQTVNKSGFFVKQNGKSTTTDAAKTEKVTPNDVVDFVDGLNTKVTAETKRDATTGVDTTTVKVDVSGDLTGITSIANGDTKISLGKDDKNNPVVNVGGAKITGVAEGDISPTSTDAVNGSQLYALAGGNKAVDTNITLPNGTTINTPVVKGDVIINVKDENGNVVEKKLEDQILMKTYNVESQTEFVTNSAAEAINKMNEGGIKFFHVNNGENSFQAQGSNTQDSSASAKYAAAIGYSAKAAGVSAVAVGHKAEAAGAQSIAIGDRATVSGAQSIAIGDGATVSGTQSISIGTGNNVTGNHSGAFGDPNTVSGDGSYAFGNDNTVTASESFVLGNRVSMNVENSVALGADTRATAGNGVGTQNLKADGKVGQTTTAGDKGKVATANVNGVVYGGFAGDTAHGVVSVGASGSERRIQNVAAGEISATSTDAINGSQLYHVAAKVGDINHNLGAVSNRVNKLDKRMRGIGANVAAAASLPQVYIPGKSMFSAAAGGYNGASAVAVGYSRASDNGKVILKLTGTANSSGQYSGGVGVGYQW